MFFFYNDLFNDALASWLLAYMLTLHTFVTITIHTYQVCTVYFDILDTLNCLHFCQIIDYVIFLGVVIF